MNPPISIIITAYNRDRYLSQAIQTVLNQTYTNFELLVWDDGSSDRSVEIAQQYADQDSRVRVVAAPHQGAALALKAAHSKVTGEYIGWVDSDDLLARTALEATSTILNAHPNVGLVYTDYIVMDEANRVKRLGQRCQIPYSKERLLTVFMTFHFRLLRRSVYDQVDGIDGTFPYTSDYDFCLKASEVTQFHHLRQPLYYYRSHSGSISQQYRHEQIQCGQRAIAHALKRRGLQS